MTKKEREQIYAKYNGHCAYCGKEIEYKDMQVDHLIPQRNARYTKYYAEEQIQSIENMMPSCRSCNLHKRANSLETYRRYVQEIPQKLLNVFIYKAGLNYKLIKTTPRKIKFYFEMSPEERQEFNKL